MHSPITAAPCWQKQHPLAQLAHGGLRRAGWLSTLRSAASIYGTDDYGWAAVAGQTLMMMATATAQWDSSVSLRLSCPSLGNRYLECLCLRTSPPTITIAPFKCQRTTFIAPIAISYTTACGYRHAPFIIPRPLHAALCSEQENLAHSSLLMLPYKIGMATGAISVPLSVLLVFDENTVREYSGAKRGAVVVQL